MDWIAWIRQAAAAAPQWFEGIPALLVGGRPLAALPRSSSFICSRYFKTVGQDRTKASIGSGERRALRSFLFQF
jgi:hypothetical protein